MNFKERFDSRTSEIEEKAAELGKEVARRHLAIFEAAVFDVYMQLGTKSFNVRVSFYDHAEFIIQFVFAAQAVYPADKNVKMYERVSEYAKLSKLEKHFFQSGYESVWHEEGFKYTPFCWQAMSLSKVLS